MKQMKGFFPILGEMEDKVWQSSDSSNILAKGEIFLGIFQNIPHLLNGTEHNNALLQNRNRIYVQ